ncbi:hypothetical protein [Crenobacter caeni]|uniref:Uncharacterized protein n=1 Tax=Crenobacter caeni TaxID=2705474 RepID=A0A6B2KLZ7_9NEIS|nr:hypothetical protein [Crenobacter caeni]NDV11235.1 hypothetical protein [Crenobacter caeni]
MLKFDIAAQASARLCHCNFKAAPAASTGTTAGRSALRAQHLDQCRDLLCAVTGGDPMAPRPMTETSFIA